MSVEKEEEEHPLDWFLRGEVTPPVCNYKEVYIQQFEGCVLLLKYNKNGVGGTLFAPKVQEGLPSAAFVRELRSLVAGFESLVMFERWEGTQHYKFKIRERDEGFIFLRVIGELEFVLLGWLGFEIKIE